MGALPFQFDVPASIWLDKSAPAGQRRRIAGVISTEELDRQQEILVQKGLDFTGFLSNGWYNDNHSRETAGIVGYPERVAQFEKGSKLPNGKVAPANCTWAEGYLLEGQTNADRIWETAVALQKAGGRRLGFSVEGKVEKRTGPNRNVVAKAKIQNVAITNCPVNTGTNLDVLSKSLQSVEQAEDDLQRAMTMGSPGAHGAGTGPAEGDGAAAVQARESLDGQKRTELEAEEEEKPTKMTKSEAMRRFRDLAYARGFNLTADQIARAVHGIFSRER